MNRITEDDLLAGHGGGRWLWHRLQKAASEGRGIQLAAVDVQRLASLAKAAQFYALARQDEGARATGALRDAVEWLCNEAVAISKEEEPPAAGRSEAAAPPPSPAPAPPAASTERRIVVHGISKQRSACSSCGAPIRWAKTEAGRAMPLQPGAVPDAASTVPASDTHWAHCPNAASHKRRKDLT